MYAHILNFISHISETTMNRYSYCVRFWFSFGQTPKGTVYDVQHKLNIKQGADLMIKWCVETHYSQTSWSSCCDFALTSLGFNQNKCLVSTGLWYRQVDTIASERWSLSGATLLSEFSAPWVSGWRIHNFNDTLSYRHLDVYCSKRCMCGTIVNIQIKSNRLFII